MIAPLLGLLLLACHHGTDAVARGTIQYGEKDGTPNKLEFAVYFLADHLTIDVPGTWRFESYRDHQTVTDARAFRSVECSREPTSEEGSALYPLVKRIFPILPFDYVVDQDTDRAKKEIAQLQADAKANFATGHPDQSNDMALPKGEGIVEYRYNDPLSGYKNKITWWLAEADDALPRTMMFMIEQPDGKLCSYNYTGFAEALDSPPSLDNLSIKETVSVRTAELAGGGNTKDGKRAVEWLKAMAIAPEFTFGSK